MKLFAQHGFSDRLKTATRHPDLVKVWVDDQLAPRPRSGLKSTKLPFSKRTDQASVAIHIYYLEDTKAVLLAGADIIAHGVRDLPLDSELIGGGP